MFQNKLKKTIKVVSGIQPSGVLHIGNYLGAVQNWVNLQNDHQNPIFFIADLHSLTSNFNLNTNDCNALTSKNNLNLNVLQTAKALLACGIDPEQSTLFCQSQVKEHAELLWILTSLTPSSWLNTMIQFKEKSKINMANIGLYTYPVLMAADVLLYKAELVPVGDDQVQHIELCKDIAIRLNKIMEINNRDINNSHVFQLPIPKPLIIDESNKSLKRIMSLQNGRAKMSKSDVNSYSCLYLFDDKSEIEKKIKKAKTDSINKIYFDLEKRPEISNLISIYCGLNNLTKEEVEAKFENASTLDFKFELIKSASEKLNFISEKAKTLKEEQVKEILEEGAKKARKEAKENLLQIKHALKMYI